MRTHSRTDPTLSRALLRIRYDRFDTGHRSIRADSYIESRRPNRCRCRHVCTGRSHIRQCLQKLRISNMDYIAIHNLCMLFLHNKKNLILSHISNIIMSSNLNRTYLLTILAPYIGILIARGHIILLLLCAAAATEVKTAFFFLLPWRTYHERAMHAV